MRLEIGQTEHIGFRQSKLVNGTEWPRLIEVYHYRIGEWVVQTICNGTAEWSKSYSTRREATRVARAMVRR